MFRVLIATIAIASCQDAPTDNPTRETLPNGATLVRYPGLPAIDSVGPGVTEAQIDLQLGSIAGDDLNFVFGDIRGVQAASDGTIYVLDAQALEVRVYSRDGQFLRTIVRRGEGPGEVLGSNGIKLSGDTLLWVYDTRKYTVVGVDPFGEELRRFDEPVRIGYRIWNAIFDDRGRYSRNVEHTDDEGREPRPGLHTATHRVYNKSYDPHTQDVDSVFIGVRASRFYVAERPDGELSSFAIPFDAYNPVVANPFGGFWHANTASYRLIRTGEHGDTLLVIEVGLPARPVTFADRSEVVQGIVEVRPEMRRTAEAIASLMPEVKPFLETHLFVDDEGRLWVQRLTPADSPPFYDLFSEDGVHAGSVRLAFEPARGRIWVQHGAVYTWVADDLGVEYVVRAPLS